MILAMDSNKLIGSEGGMPWHISSELQYFKRVTMGKPIIMGRITFESIGKALPGRTNIVVTRNEEWSEAGVSAVSSLQDGYGVASEEGAEEAMVIGGAALCQQAMPLTDRLYLTVIDHEFSGDTWLDSFDWGDWTVVSEDPQDEREQGGYQYCYYVLDRREADAAQAPA